MSFSSYYFNDGRVRGKCPHKHRTLGGAVRCLKADQAACERQHGYSDRVLKFKRVASEPAEQLNPQDYHPSW